MSDNYLTVIPTDPYWQPGRDAADRAAAVLSGMLPDDDARLGLDAQWHDSVEVVWCGAETSLNELVYDWPMGFARFRIEVLYPNRGWLTDEELAAVADALGHPLRQVLIHF
ncbi:hypothetical protein Sipo8835_25475 [Streptomyces ipomoeae]|uniref:Uncharacterized protein n=2 Tax=Streptomyces ipomoeae TaxID=103232 RepID=L1KS95_9ACTN|nr:hypothetical protein [Streptomyces ipomoeae]EKX63330.1 hypothetical protein STRIP9103_05092 [Streptomyces ipomoeae 91-03]MDX2700865.1 hypothetical protein [Streptomyces ipomoeae]MDX2828579.1 hypothetical protein [Streptomyces ipomoeae]MDX2846525.1 hypothetical protein [Streptomyces ipomoeae]MDX2881069.1 hypothetical protein [Streptomyces ipomoeae]